MTDTLCNQAERYCHSTEAYRSYVNENPAYINAMLNQTL